MFLGIPKICLCSYLTITIKSGMEVEDKLSKIQVFLMNAFTYKISEIEAL